MPGFVTTNEDGKMTFTTGADLTKGQRVKLSSGNVVAAGLNEEHIGVTLHPAASGDPVTIKLTSGTGTFAIQCASTCTQGAALYSAAAGQVDDASGGAGAKRFIALQACAAANEIIECLPYQQITA